jgi:N-acetylglutamate synthase-like GNAT family acetyltransferase
VADVLKVLRVDDHSVFGACVFVEALVADAETVRSAYAEESPGWPPLHFAIAKPTPEALDPWYRLGFAQMHAYGVRPSGGERESVPGVSVRCGGPADLDDAMRIDALIYEAQAASPSYSSYSVDPEEHRSTWVETLEADDIAYFVAERDGRIAGHATVYPDVEDSDAMHLASTAVLPDERGSGIGRVLTSWALAYAAEQGFPRLRTNWRVTNLAASRYWPARGFELSHIRLVRRVPTL